MRPIEGFWAVVVANAVLGVPAYFIAFLFAYGFQDEVGLANHLTFLVLIATFAVVSGLVGTALPWQPEPRAPAVQRAAFGMQMSLALNLAVVGLGSVVSATHKDEGSVSADFSTATDVLLFCGFLLMAGVFAMAALRVDLRSQPDARS